MSYLDYLDKVIKEDEMGKIKPATGVQFDFSILMPNIDTKEKFEEYQSKLFEAIANMVRKEFPKEYEELKDMGGLKWQVIAKNNWREPIGSKKG